MVPLRGNARRRIAEGIGGSNWTDFKEDDLGWPRYQRDACVTYGFQRCPQIPKAATSGPGDGALRLPGEPAFSPGRSRISLLCCVSDSAHGCSWRHIDDRLSRWGYG